MAVFRVVKNKDNPYVVKNTFYDFDARLSLKAKGLMGIFLARPDDWEFYHNELLKHCKDGKDSLSSAIEELIKAGYIRRVIKRGDSGKLAGGYDYTIYELPQEPQEEDKNVTECGFSESGENRNRQNPLSENPPLLNNNLIPNIEIKLNNENIYSSTAAEIIDYLNKICDTSYKSSSKNTFDFIKARLNEKYTIDDFKKVIDIKAKEWKGTNMEKYLRPATLFGNKFESYLNQKPMTGASAPNYTKKSNWDYDGQRQYDYDDLEKKLLAKSFDSPEGVDG